MHTCLRPSPSYIIVKGSAVLGAVADLWWWEGLCGCGCLLGCACVGEACVMTSLGRGVVGDAEDAEG